MIDKRTIFNVAREAIGELSLSCEVAAIEQEADSTYWRIIFTGGFEELRDEFHDDAGHEETRPIIKRKIKDFLQRAEGSRR